MSFTESEWDKITNQELRSAAKVARASGGLFMAAAADAWEKQAQAIEDSFEEMA